MARRALELYGILNRWHNRKAYITPLRLSSKAFRSSEDTRVYTVPAFLGRIRLQECNQTYHLCEMAAFQS
eukprot:939232-Pyramimonas_sp.AAC.1